MAGKASVIPTESGPSQQSNADRKHTDDEAPSHAFPAATSDDGAQDNSKICGVQTKTVCNVIIIVAVALAVILAGALGYITIAVRWILVWVPKAGPLGVIGLIFSQGICQAFAVLGAGTIFAMASKRTQRNLQIR
eukprot:SAG31_NODE_5416_length_2550_cov_1.080375_1_plen_135_part_00